jgi:deoxyribodipyrimidine photo-lyase
MNIFIFRRDYRLYDNIGFINCIKDNKNIIPIFIFTPNQIKNNDYKSSNCIQFLIESLKDLNKDINLNYFFGNDIDILKDIIKNNNIKSIFTNTDYTPFAIKRDLLLENFCNKNNINFNKYDDVLLYNIKGIKTSSGSFYKKFTPYYNSAIKINVDKPIKENMKNIKVKKIKNKYSINLDYINKYYKINPNINTNGGRTNGLKIIKNIKDFKKYEENRDYFNYKTTYLSSYLKFGCISIRELYHTIKDKLGNKHPLIRQLIWRDFYYQLGYNSDRTFKGAYNKKYDKLKWDYNKTIFKKWCDGETGYPIIDACMKQLNETGYMHNRGRMAVASFLIKNLKINWEWGEKYFATKLVDYDPLVNNGNWQFMASTGPFSQPYFRLLNPWIQSKKFDNECKYIKKWLPILKDIKNKDIHKWNTAYKNYNIKYPKPIIDYDKSKNEGQKMYKELI